MDRQLASLKQLQSIFTNFIIRIYFQRWIKKMTLAIRSSLKLLKKSVNYLTAALSALPARNAGVLVSAIFN